MKATKRQLALFRSLRTRKGRRETGLFLVEGLRLCRELTEAEVPVEQVLVAEDRMQDPRCRGLAEQFEKAGAAPTTAPAWLVEKISDTVHSQGILAAARWTDRAAAEMRFPKKARVLALDRVSDPGNVGTIIRTAAWFGAAAVLLGRGCADLLNPKTVRATMGGIFHLPILRDVGLPEAVDYLKQLNFHVAVAAVDGSHDWRTWCEPNRSILILGSEAHGVAQELRNQAHHSLAVPRPGAGDSLNVAVTAGVFLSAAVQP